MELQRLIRFSAYQEIGIPTAGKNSYSPEKGQRYVYVWLGHLAVHLRLTQHYQSTILQFKINFKKYMQKLIFTLISLTDIKTNSKPLD